MNLENLIKKIKKNHYFSNDENQFLFQLIETMESTEQKRIIKDILVKGNNGIVFHELRFYKQDPEYDDLVQESFIALFDAVNSYDYKTMASFYSYAKRCIFHVVIQYLNQKKRLITIPRYYFRKYTNKEERDALMKAFEPVSLNQKMKEEEMELQETIAGSENVEFEVLQHLIKGLIIDAISQLDAIEQYVIIHRFGLYNAVILTQREIAENLKLTIAKVNWIEKKAIGKLRNTQEIKFLK